MVERRSVEALRLHPEAELIPPMSPGEYRSLQADIGSNGILQPLEVTSERVVLDGRHRLRAAQELGLSEVPVRMVAPEDEVEYMLTLALERRHLNAGQRALLALERDDYRAAREAANMRKTQGGNELRAALPEAERPRELVARLAGVSARTVQDAITVRGDADPDMRERVRSGSCSVSVAAQQVRHQQRMAALAAPALPDGPFRVIYADPPWQLGSPASDRAPENHYPTLPLEEIRAMRVPAADDAACFLWAVNQRLPEALEVMASWEFEYRTNLVWVKDRFGLGFYVRGQHELLLLGTRGRMPLPAEADRPASVVNAGRTQHSAKPPEVYDLIERMYPGLSRVELFARQRRDGWTAWGNELPGPKGREVA